MRIKMIGLFSLILLLQACASTATLIGDNTFRSSDRSYSLRMAEGWQVTSVRGGKFTMALSKGAVVLLGTTINAGRISDSKLQDTARQINDAFAGQLHGTNLVQSEVKLTRMDGLHYVKTTGEGRTAEKNIPLLFSSYIIAGNNHLYVIFVTGKDDQYINEQDVVLKIPASFHEL